MDRQLSALEQIAKKRYERAQSAIFAALQEEELAKKALETAKLNYEDYKVKLPQLVKELYDKILGKLTDRTAVADVLQEELKLTAKLSQLQEVIDKCATSLELASATVKKAYAELAVQERKRTALLELRSEMRKQRDIMEARALAKVMDEFAGYRYISKQ